jgi:hypothetical protein
MFQPKEIIKEEQNKYYAYPLKMDLVRDIAKDLFLKNIFCIEEQHPKKIFRGISLSLNLS